MGIFDKAKELQKLKQMADETKKALADIKATGISKKEYVKLTLDGEKNLKNIEFSDDAMNIGKDKLAEMVKEAFKMASKEVEKQMKKKMKGSGLENYLLDK